MIHTLLEEQCAVQVISQDGHGISPNDIPLDELPMYTHQADTTRGRFANPEVTDEHRALIPKLDP